MRSRYKIVDEDGIYFTTSTIVEWIPVFTKKRYFNTITDTLTFCREHKELKVYAYVILDNHIHLIVSGDHLSKTFQDFKRYTSKLIIDTARSGKNIWLLDLFKYYKKPYKKDSTHQVWQEGSHPQLISSDEMYCQKVEYIHYNPVRRDLVEEPELWLYSSARNFALGNGKGVMDIDFLE